MYIKETVFTIKTVKFHFLGPGSYFVTVVWAAYYRLDHLDRVHRRQILV